MSTAAHKHPQLAGRDEAAGAVAGAAGRTRAARAWAAFVRLPRYDRALAVGSFWILDLGFTLWHMCVRRCTL